MIAKYVFASLFFLITLVGYPVRSDPFYPKHQPIDNSFKTIRSSFLQQEKTIQVKDVRISYIFGEILKIHARVLPENLITNSILLIQPTGEEIRNISITPSTDGVIDIQINLKDSPLPLFTRIDYWFMVKSDGKEFSSEKYWFDYVDNRFIWHSLENQSISVFWQTGGLDFGQSIMNSAQKSLSSPQPFFQPNLSSPLKVFVYSNPADLRSALETNPPYLVSGHASPELGVILVSIQPGPQQNTEIERQIPHEITHILQYRALDKSYLRLPIWFLEGSAVIAEQYTTPIYEDLLLKAKKDDSLLPMSSLCSAFPQEPGSALLAYAQSASFVKNIRQYFGDNAMNQLVQNYANGMGCNDGFATALGISLGDYEKRWLRQIGDNREVSSARQPSIISYFLIFFLLILIPFITLFAGPKYSQSKVEINNNE